MRCLLAAVLLLGLASAWAKARDAQPAEGADDVLAAVEDVPGPVLMSSERDSLRYTGGQAPGRPGTPTDRGAEIVCSAAALGVLLRCARHK